MGGRHFTDTSDFFAIDCGDEIVVDRRHFRVNGHARERRFGIEDPKFWVKMVSDTVTGERKIIKLSYLESFETSLSGVKIKCFRSPAKEAAILALVRDNPSFMQGQGHQDAMGNTIRLLDIVRGRTFFDHIVGLPFDHRTYFHTALPQILRKLVTTFSAIDLLHAEGFRHGDIRNDHIIVEQPSGNYVWIDFDYDFEASENPFGLDVFGLGNILLYAVGKGFHNLHQIAGDPQTYGDLKTRLEPGDFSILERWRLMNLQKLYAHIPRALNDILMHFARDANVYYEYIGELVEDLNAFLAVASTPEESMR